MPHSKSIYIEVVQGDAACDGGARAVAIYYICSVYIYVYILCPLRDYVVEVGVMGKNDEETPEPCELTAVLTHGANDKMR